MPQTRPNGAKVPVNSDAYNLTGDLATMADTSNVIIPCASQAVRDALTPFVGMTITRTDLGGAFFTWDGAAWQTQVTWSNWITADTNWIYGGGLYKTVTAGKTFIQLIGIMYRQAGGSFTVNVGTDVSMGVYIPAGWRPTLPISSLAPVTTGTTHNGEPIVTVDTTGALILHATVSNVTVATGAQLSFNTGWYL